MITRQTKVQLIVFALITMVGVAFVGAKYARLDRLLFDTSYQVVAHFAESGGIFEGAEVSYRGVTVGRVGELKLTDDGVDVMLDIDNSHDRIPSDTRALVGNRSAVGEQYVELQPETDTSPYLREHSEIPVDMTATPISSTKLLVDLDRTVNSVDKGDLRTVVDEFGKAFKGAGGDIAQIIDTSNSFIETANENFDLTSALIDDSNVVLRTQLDKASSIRSFAADLSRFSDTMVSSDADLRTVIESGSATATELRRFLEENQVDLGELINSLVTTGEITLQHLDGLEMVLVVYPYVVQGAYTVVDKDPSTGLYNAHFGMVLTTDPPVCHAGYESTDTRPPQDRADRPMNEQAICREPATQSNPRGGQHAPRAGTAYRAPVVGAYDRTTKKFTYTDTNPSDSVTSVGGGAYGVRGQESWKWLLLEPLASAAR